MIVIVFFIQKKFSRLDKTEKVFVAIDIAITILWLLLSYNSYMHGIYESLLGNVMSVGAFIHIILLVSSIDSFFPIIRDTIKNPDSDEHHYPWVFWSLGYAIWFVADFLRFYFIKDLEIWSIFYPIVYFMLHATLATILFIKDRKKRV